MKSWFFNLELYRINIQIVQRMLMCYFWIIEKDSKNFFVDFSKKVRTQISILNYTMEQILVHIGKSS